ncbi:DNA sulfur modification protein DndB [Cellulomonas sp. NPDC055163]
MSTQLTFKPAFLSSDGGEEVFELRTTLREIVSLYDSGILEVGNIRPDHAKVVTKRGGERFKRTSDRQKRWTEQLSRGRGILGNLSWNADPTFNEIEWDEEDGRLFVRGRDGGEPQLRTPDSATRHRSIIDAAKAPMPTVDLDRPVSVRVWMVPVQGAAPDELTEPAVFDSYNQDGQPVNATVAKHSYQRDGLEVLVRELVYNSPHLGLDNVETIQNSVARESSKLVAYNTLFTAFKDGYTLDVDDPDARKTELAWLLRFWDALVAAVPEVGRVSLAQRKEYRRDSVAGSATLVHAYVRLANYLRTQGMDPELVGALGGRKVVLEEDGVRTVIDPVTGNRRALYGSGDRVEFFSPDNPRWVTAGVVVAKPQKDGSTAAEVRNAFQTRVAAANVLVEEIEPAALRTKQDALNYLCDLLGITRLSIGVGSSVPAALFDAIALRVGVESGPMPVVARRVVEKAGMSWSASSDSTGTPSGGGSTVTLDGLRQITKAVKQLIDAA